MPGTVLVVCTANVCRSPLAAEVLQEGFAHAAFQDVTVLSAGTRASEGQPACAVSIERLGAASSEPLAAHRSRRLTSDLVSEADLVITMEREQRSIAVQAAPGSQTKVFALREVEALLPHLRPQTAPVLDVAALAAALHAVRGMEPLLPDLARRRRWWSRAVEPIDPMTLLDGHGMAREQHVAAVDAVLDAARTTSARLAAAFGPTSAGR